MPNLCLPFAVTDPAPTVMALDRAVFEGRYSDSTLVEADISDGNRGFALYGDVTNCLEYHLWALTLVMGTEYKARPMHTSASYDVSAFYSLRKVGQIHPPPRAAAAAATVARYAETKLLGRDAVRQMCDAFDIARRRPGPERWLLRGSNPASWGRRTRPLLGLQTAGQ